MNKPKLYLRTNLVYMRTQVKGLTQEQLADETGIYKSAIGALEEGRTKVGSLEKLKILANFFDTSLDHFCFTDLRKYYEAKI